MNQTDQVVLRLEGVTKKIGKQTLVDTLSFDVKKGEIVGLLGPNGAGKTTTIRMIVGLISITEGDILISNKSVKHNFTEAVRKLGAIVENPEFYGYMTGMDNLKQYQRMTKGITDERIAEVVKVVGLEEAMNKNVKNYSLGMRQRLGIAQALLHSPDILILDEPTNGLDPAGIREMRDYLKKVAEEDQIAVLVSSHLLSEMELMCSRVVVIQKGKFVQQHQLNGAEQTDTQTISIKVDQVTIAEHALQQVNGCKIVSLSPQISSIIVEATEEIIPNIVNHLCSHQVRVYRVESIKQSLEDEFLKWTGGNQIV